MARVEYIEKHRSPHSRLAGRVVPDHEPDGARVLFVTVNPSAIDVVRGAPLSGPVREVFTKHYLEPLGLGWGQIAVKHLCPVHLVGEDGRPREASPVEFSQMTVGRAPIAYLGKTAAENCPGFAGTRLPHPGAIRRYGNSGEVRRKIARLKKMLTNAAQCANTSGDDRDHPVRIVKADQERRQTLGIVLEPLTRDLQGDVLTPEEIEKAAHDYLIRSRVVGESHEREATGSSVVESYIAPVDFDAGGQSVKAGTWLMVMQHDAETFDRIKAGEFNGYSIGALGTRQPVN